MGLEHIKSAAHLIICIELYIRYCARILRGSRLVLFVAAIQYQAISVEKVISIKKVFSVETVISIKNFTND